VAQVAPCSDVASAWWCGGFHDGWLSVAVLCVSNPAEVRQVWTDWAVLTTRLWRVGAAWLDQEWTVGPLPVGEDGWGREVIIRTMTNLSTGVTSCRSVQVLL